MFTILVFACHSFQNTKGTLRAKTPKPQRDLKSAIIQQVLEIASSKIIVKHSIFQYREQSRNAAVPDSSRHGVY